jgi:hypothetical protein
MGMKPATTERTSPPHEHKSLFSSGNLEEETNRAGGGRKEGKAKGKSKREKQKGKAMELSSAGRQAKKGPEEPEEPEEQTNNQNAEAKDSWPVNCRKLRLGLNPQWRRQD